jgi:hypothetical protein
VAVVLLLLIAGLFLAWRDLIWGASGVSLAAWLLLAAFAACIANQPLLREHILSRLAEREIPARTPLPWHGILRSEPSRLPWGL